MNVTCGTARRYMTKDIVRIFHLQQSSAAAAAAGNGASSSGAHVACFASSSLQAPPLTVETMNGKAYKTKYAVRGRMAEEAVKLQRKCVELAAAGKSDQLPFTHTTQCNIGNPHALGQKPISFGRDVLSAIANPRLLKVPNLFDEDTRKCAEKYLTAMGVGGLGAYTHGKGVPLIRQEVANFIADRDGYPADPEHIYLLNGASQGVAVLHDVIIRSGDQYKDGFLTPIPQYPLYSALSTLRGAFMVPYYLNEDKEWSITVNELQAAVDKARGEGVCVRGLVVINPGNPTGQVLTEKAIREVIAFCERENLLILADEVYQENIWKPKEKPFVSFKKVYREMGYGATADDHRVVLVSFHSASKGFMGECGLRGGYMEVCGLNGPMHAELLKMFSISLCSSTSGQIMTGLMVKPPVGLKDKDSSKFTGSQRKYIQEKDAIMSSLKRKAIMLVDALNKLEGVTCNAAEGAMYAFPRITLPAKAIEAAKKEGCPADEHYTMYILETTGLILVPGTGFGQVAGTYHFRTTFLPAEEEMPKVIKAFAKAHNAYLQKYK